jgi:hypothetical protein
MTNIISEQASHNDNEILSRTENNFNLFNEINEPVNNRDINNSFENTIIFNEIITNNDGDNIIYTMHIGPYVEHMFTEQRYLTCESFSELTTMPYSEMIKVDGMFIDDLCAICSEQYEDDISVTASGCGHCFCTGCATKWLTEHSRLCPTCRHSN